MKKPSLLLLPLLISLFACSVVAGEKKKALTLEQVSGRGDRAERVRFSGPAPSWEWDGERKLLVDPDRKRVDPKSGTKLDADEVEAGRTEPSEETRKELIKAFRELEGWDEGTASRVVRRKEDSGANGAVELYTFEGKFWVVREGTQPQRLELPGGASGSLGDLSPDGSWLACVSDHDLHLVSTEGAECRALTSGGSKTLLNGELDWVYQEEVYGRGDFKAFWWSPDSKQIAFLSLDGSEVFDFTVIDHIETGHFRVKPEVTSYPKAGDPNPKVRVGVIPIESGQAVWADFSQYEAEEPLVVRVEWTPSGDRLLFVVQDRIQQSADLVAFDSGTGEQKILIKERNDTWVERPPSPRWLADGSFLWQSDRTDYNHLYHYSGDGELIGAVTSGKYAVRRIVDVDEEQKLIWFTSTKDGAVNDNLYRVRFDGSRLQRLTEGAGSHTARFNSDRSYFLDSYSSLAQPPAVRLCTGDGKIVRELGKAEIPDLDQYMTSEWELVEIRARDGVMLDAAVLKPTPFRSGKAYPVWLPTYSGPDAPSVANRWDGGAWSQFLAQQGFVVFQVNVRTASGKGHWAIEQCYKQLGVQELADLEDAVDWLTAHTWADASRVGITGMSYGGFMSAFALTHSDRFALGIAESGVYDWGMYDSIYTERFMSTPQKNPDGYAAASVLKAAGNLKGHLLLTHGVMDDNVHVQNAMQLIFALQKAGKQFDFMLYPQSRHGIGDPDQRWFSRQLNWRKMQEVLKP
ncbi:MAG: DPP IV N-terminal domain-containing protein [Planctomycetota bacterium]